MGLLQVRILTLRTRLLVRLTSGDSSHARDRSQGGARLSSLSTELYDFQRDCAAGPDNADVAEASGVRGATVGKWREVLARRALRRAGEIQQVPRNRGRALAPHRAPFRFGPKQPTAFGRPVSLPTFIASPRAAWRS